MSMFRGYDPIDPASFDRRADNHHREENTSVYFHSQNFSMLGFSAVFFIRGYVERPPEGTRTCLTAINMEEPKCLLLTPYRVHTHITPRILEVQVILA